MKNEDKKELENLQNAKFLIKNKELNQNLSNNIYLIGVFIFVIFVTLFFKFIKNSKNFDLYFIFLMFPIMPILAIIFTYIFGIFKKKSIDFLFKDDENYQSAKKVIKKYEIRKEIKKVFEEELSKKEVNGNGRENRNE